MTYKITASERTSASASEMETKAMLYLFCDDDEDKIHGFAIDFFNDVTGVDRNALHLYDIQSKGNDAGPADLGEEMVTLYNNLPIFLSSAYACLAATHVLQRFHVIFDMIFSAFQHISNENTHFSSTNVDGTASVNGGQRDRTAVRQAPHACRLCTSLCVQTPSHPATNSQRWE